MLGAWQVMQRLSRVGRRQDYWVVNFGLHYSPSYREELEQLVNEARAPSCHSACMRSCCGSGKRARCAVGFAMVSGSRWRLN
jgi:hypothetical protein